MEKLKGARDIAQSALYAVFYQGAYSNLGLNAVLNKYDPPQSERALASELVYGVIQNYRMLDAYIAAFSKTPINKLQRRALIILRISFYQLLYLDKIPKSAVVNEAVKLARSHLNSGAAGFVNGVLRAFLREEGFTPKLPEDTVGRLSVEYSLPVWMAAHFIKSYGVDKGTKIIKASNLRPSVYIHRNIYRAPHEELMTSLLDDKAAAYESGLIEGAYVLEAKGDMTRLMAFKDGLFFFEDITSQIAAKAVCAKQGDVIIDVCASPGAKSFAIAQDMEGCGRILSFDLHEKRVGLIETAAKRLGIDMIECKVNDASLYDETLAETADAVLADVPCSGLGTIAKKPDIRLKQESEMLALPDMQLLILETASKYVKPGGTLVYSTCTLNPAENEDIVMAFLKRNKNFHITHVPYTDKIEESILVKREKTVTFLPDKDLGDGFFIAKMIKE